ncbi:slr1659 superfamily regulator [Capilliphycus salinus ALCB114379]|uniref:slr1659 superfamily regulator n=1 Tax=Capilliphycus salinus TaxID=2768948 RepID=UPI0039A74D5B
MDIQELNTEEYQVKYNNESRTISFVGSLRLSDLEETNPIVQLLNDVLTLEPDTITLNLRALKYLNSSGINMLSKFVIQVRRIKTVNLIVLASSEIPWQSKSLKNLQRLMPSLQLEVE